MFKEAIGRLRDAYLTWQLFVPQMIAHLLEHYPDRVWEIKIVTAPSEEAEAKSGVELCRFELSKSETLPKATMSTDATSEG